MSVAVKTSRIALSALVALLLGACAGGGGGGGNPGPAPLPPPSPPPGTGFPPLAPPHADGDFPDLGGGEFNANWGVGGANAQVAWQNGATGAGVLVGVVDDGIHPNHPELRGRISPDSVDIVSGRDALVTDQSHGSELSALIAGNYNDSQTVGVAFDATILAIRADNASGSFNGVDLANAVDYAREHGVDVINLSLGSASPTSAVFREAIQRATAAGIIIVVSAGNDGDDGATEPNYPGFLATDPNVSNGLIMIAGGLNPDGSVNGVSNPPGSAAEWYLTAPGWQIIVPDFGPAGPVPGFQTCGLGPNGDLCRIQGTSYASPHVTGAVALVMDAFPGMTPAEVVELLFVTADDTGAPGIDAVNGRGRLNIGRAFQPVGPLSVPLVAGQRAVETHTPIGVSGAPFGNGLRRHDELWSVSGFDHYRRTFAVDLSDNWVAPLAGPSPVAQAPLLWRTARAAHGLRMQMALAEDIAPESYRLPASRSDLQPNPTRIDADLGAGLSVSFAAHGAQTENTTRYGDAVGHLDFMNADRSLQLTHRFGDLFSIAFVSESGSAPERPVMSLHGLVQTPPQRSAAATRANFNFGRHALEITAGRAEDESGLLGLAWSDALGATPRGETRFAGFAWRYRDGGFGADLEVESGVSDLAATGWLRVDNAIRTSSYSFSLQHAYTPAWLGVFAGGEGSVSFTVSQPLRVEAGQMSFMAPTATKYGRRSLRYEERSFAPVPDGRETRLGLGYRYFAGQNVSAFGEAIHVLEPGHDANAAPETVLRLGVRLAH